MFYIHQKTNGTVKHPTIEELEQIAEAEGFPMEINEDVLGIACAYGKHFVEEGQLDGARAMFEIVYELTENESIKDILDELSEA